MFIKGICFLVFSLIVNCLFSGCGSKTARKMAQVKDSTMVILTQEGDTVLGNESGKNIYYKFVEIDMNEAFQGQQIIKSFLEANPIKVEWAENSIDKEVYNSNYKQFLGLKNEKEQKIIWINSMCYKSTGWEDDFIKVLGGGTCYFNLKVNLESEAVFDVFVNGPK